jgi:hypothetical protein
MNDEMLNEMDELLKTEHGHTLTIWSMECANAGEKSYKKAVFKQTVGRVIGVCAVIGAVNLGKKIYHKLKKNTTEDEEPVEVE